MPLHVAPTRRMSDRYDRPAGLGPRMIRRCPAPHSRTPVVPRAAVSPEAPRPLASRNHARNHAGTA